MRNAFSRFHFVDCKRVWNEARKKNNVCMCVCAGAGAGAGAGADARVKVVSSTTAAKCSSM
jgi:hypothetical protein